MDYWSRPVYADWLTLLKRFGITDQDEGDLGSKRWKMMRKNAVYAAWFTFHVLRVGLSNLVIDRDHHVWGHTFHLSGNTIKLVLMLASVGIAPLLCNRLACVYLVWKGKLAILQTVKQMDQETDPVLRRRKVTSARLVHSVTLAAMPAMSVSVCIMMTGMYALNVSRSSSQLETTCWTAWWLVDLCMGMSFGPDGFLFPAIWLMTALNYRFDVMKLQQLIDDVGRGRGKESKSEVRRQVDVILKDTHDLIRHANQVNWSASEILSVQLLFTTPIVSLAVFIAVYSDNVVFRMLMPIAAASYALFSSGLQACAGEITSQSEIVYRRLASLIRGPRSMILSLDQKHELLALIEEHETPAQRLALCTFSGDKYTKTAFLVYLLETVLQFTLIVTFSNYMHVAY